MCGIAGYFSYRNKIDVSIIRQMAASIAHRGPDAEQFYSNEHTAFAHRRLSIIDLSAAANQPMFSQDGRWAIMFNGEIYNYHEIASELHVPLHTHSDTEVMLEAFSQWGLDAVNKLNGMFVIALYDQLDEALYLLRDRLGVKPLFYFKKGNEIFFGSEIKALTAIGFVNRELTINRNAISYYLQLGYIPEPETIWNEIKKLPAGCILKITKDSFDFNCYWKPEDKITSAVITDEKDAKQKLNELLESAVQYRMISDVPFGIFLSGGIDSSLITALAQKNNSTPVKTFSIGFNEHKYNEAQHAATVADYLGTDHHEFKVTYNDAIQLCEESMDLFDEPFADSSAIPTMLVSKLARQQVKMVLGGDGGDELFMGYGMYRWAERLNHPLVKIFHKPIAAIFSVMNDRYKRAATLFDYDSSVSIQQHIFSQEQYFFSNLETKSLLNENYSETELEIPASTARKLSVAETQALFDLKYYLKDDLLVKVDRATMRYGLECRSPFLDYRVVEFAFNVSQQLKMKNGELKILPRVLLKDYLPEELFNRPKQGFALPIKLWLQKELKYLIDDYLSEETIRKHAVVDYTAVADLKKRFFLGNQFLYNRLWNLIVLHRWLRKNDIR
ncbi:MAG: asparagine synthase (glutamine-hydrolyzing) [Chitinophagales bacterium]|nr:asparagine synthase (glutamine-hydrolyzing) [Chitinophagales bacterium]